MWVPPPLGCGTSRSIPEAARPHIIRWRNPHLAHTGRGVKHVAKGQNMKKEKKKPKKEKK
jgi:hypothetical protein